MSPSALRVLLVTPRYPPLTGGVETHVREVATRLVKRGVRTTVLPTDLDQSLPQVDELDVLRSFVLGPTRAGVTITGPPRSTGW